MNDSLTGKTILITGASSGIGEEFAKQLYALKNNLILVARRIDKLNSLKLELEETGENKVTCVQADLILDSDLKKIVYLIKSTKIDILINNAGRGSFGHLEDMPIEEEKDMVKLNVTAPLVLSHTIISQLKERRVGGIINISSIAGFQPLPFMSTYSGTKAFDLFHSLALRYELKRFGIRVLAVCPGPVATEFGGVARVPGSWSGIKRDPVEDTVRLSLKAYRDNKAKVFPGKRAWLMSLPTRLLPLSMTTFFSGRALEDVIKRKS